MALTAPQIAALVNGGIPLVCGIFYIFCARMIHTTRLAKGKSSTLAFHYLLGSLITIVGAVQVFPVVTAVMGWK
jgi:hypothetical protein